MPDARIELVTREDGSTTVKRHFDDLGQSAHGAAGHVHTLHSAIDLIREAFAAIGIGFSVEKIIEMGDAFTNVNNKLRQVTSSSHELESVNEQLLDVANRQSQSVDGLGNLYYTLANATKRLGTDSASLIQITQNITQTLTNAGRSSDDAGLAIRRLAAGMAEGTISGRAITSLFVQFPELAANISKAAGISEAAFRVLAVGGNISTKSLIGYLKDMGAGAAETGAKLDDTIGKAVTRFSNNMQELIGKLNSSSGVFKSIGVALDTLGAAFRLAADNSKTFVDAISLGIIFSGPAAGATLLSQKIKELAADMFGLKTATNDAAHVTAEKTAGDHAATTATTAAAKSNTDLSNSITVIRGGMAQVIPQAQQFGNQINLIRGGVSATVPVVQNLSTATTGLASANNQNAGATLTAYEKTLVAKGVMQDFTQATGQTNQKILDFSQASTGAGQSVQDFSGSTKEAGASTETLSHGTTTAAAATRDYTSTLSETTRQVGAHGAATSTTTQSIIDENGAMIPLSRTIEHTNASVGDFITGAKTVTKELMQTDGSVKVVSQSIEGAVFDWEKFTATVRKTQDALDKTNNVLRNASGMIVGSLNSVADGTRHAQQNSADAFGDWETSIDRWATASEAAADRVINSMNSASSATSSASSRGGGGGGGSGGGGFQGSGVITYMELAAELSLRKFVGNQKFLRAGATDSVPQLFQWALDHGWKVPPPASPWGNFAQGGAFTVGGSQADHPVTINAGAGEKVTVQTSAQQRSNGDTKVYMTVISPDANSFRASERQTTRRLGLQIQRVASRANNPV